MAEVITSGKVIQKPEIVLDATDFLPPGIIGVRTQTREEAGHPEDFGSADNNGNELLEMDGADYVADVTSLPIPTFMKVVSQVSRVEEDKTILVDVVIETDDFPGITEFDARLIKSPMQ